MPNPILENKRLLSVLLFVVCLAMLVPSYFINNIHSHDWGGDFAMYIKQAQNIVLGVPQTDNNYIFNPENAVLGPKTYPIGFPLLLAPVYAAFGNDISAFIDLMAVLAVLFGLMVFILLRDRVHWGVALVVALGISYHTTLLFFKREVMADIPFALFALLGLFAVDRKQWWIAGLALLLAALTKSVGVTLLIAVGFLLFVQQQAAGKKDFTSLLKHPIARLLLVVAAGYFLLSNVIFQTDSSEGYGSVWSDFELSTVLTKNLKYYFEFLRWFLFDTINEKPIGTLVTGLFLALAFLGWAMAAYKKLGAFEVWFPVYVLVLLAYPYHASGLRFLLPAIPLLFVYVATVFGSVNKRFKPALVLLAAVPFLFTFQRSAELVKDWPKDVDGPQSPHAMEMLDYVRTNTPKDAIILFSKPRVLALYTDRQSIGNGRYQSMSSLYGQVDSLPITHVIQADALWNPDIDSLLMDNQDLTTLEFETQGFKVYRID
jgi:hypothetical protein